jgi:putative transposase
VEQRAIFLDDVDRRLFLSLLRMATRKTSWVVDAYTLMGNHFHLVVTSQLDRLSVGMHALCFRYATSFNARYGRTGHLFQGRFGARSVEADDDFHALCDYVFDNPVRAGLCDLPGAYPWSGGDWFPLATGRLLATPLDHG